MSKESITLYYRAGSSDKVYHAAVDERPGGYTVNVAYGRRGSTMQTGTKTHAPVSFEEAEKIYNKLIREKTSKGYAPGANGTPYSGTENAQRSTGILPQLLNPIDESDAEKLVADSTHWLQEKKDGRRVILCAGDKITGINRKGLSIGLPQSVVESATAISLSFIIDGEAIGDTFHAFDLIELSGVNYRARPYRERFDLLACLLKKRAGSIKLVPALRTPGEKRDAFNRLKQLNAEGVVFKNPNAPYMPGRPASGGPQLKFKFVATGSFIVAGVNAGKRSVGLEALGDGQHVYVGNVSVPVNQELPKRGALVEVRYYPEFRIMPSKSGALNGPE